MLGDLCEVPRAQEIGVPHPLSFHLLSPPLVEGNHCWLHLEVALADRLQPVPALAGPSTPPSLGSDSLPRPGVPVPAVVGSERFLGGRDVARPARPA